MGVLADSSLSDPMPHCLRLLQGDVGLADGSPSDLNAAPAGSLDQQVEHQQQQAAAGTAFAGSAAGAGPSKAAAPAMSASRQREANLTGFL